MGTAVNRARKPRPSARPSHSSAPNRRPSSPRKARAWRLAHRWGDALTRAESDATGPEKSPPSPSPSSARGLPRLAVPRARSPSNRATAPPPRAAPTTSAMTARTWSQGDTDAPQEKERCDRRGRRRKRTDRQDRPCLEREPDEDASIDHPRNVAAPLPSPTPRFPCARHRRHWRITRRPPGARVVA